jgi:hypothetical protein
MKQRHHSPEIWNGHPLHITYLQGMILNPKKQLVPYCCIAVKGSVPQGMFVCFDKRGWLVCRSSGDTEGCRKSVMR